MDLSKTKKIHIIGIEGAGTSALARMYKSAGIEVTGSDEGDHFYHERLRQAGIRVFHKFAPENIPADADLVVYSTAYNAERNAEVAAALRGGIKTVTYAEALAFLFNEKYGIAVCGSHGKTTTSAWLGFVMERSGLKPGIIVGARVPQLDDGEENADGFSNYLVAEADEYQDKLKHLRPKAVLLNNVDYDHPDFFPSEEEYRRVFSEFVKKVPKGGWLVANFGDRETRKAVGDDCRGKLVTYAIDPGIAGVEPGGGRPVDYLAYDLRRGAGRQCFKVKMRERGGGSQDSEPSENCHPGSQMSNVKCQMSSLGDFSIILPGRHNVLNALAVIAAAIELEIPLVDIREYLEDFRGAARRLQVMGDFRGAVIIDDYAHHPTEIRASLSAIRELYKYRKITVVFHPHTFTRTKALLDEFARSFSEADEIIILDIYGSARERQGGVHSRDLVERIKEMEGDNAFNSDVISGSPLIGPIDLDAMVKHIPTLEECEKYLRGRLEADDVLILMGAGDVYKIGEKLANR